MKAAMDVTHDADSRAGLAGRKVLVAENEVVIALDIQAMLGRFGCVTSGLTSTTADALAALKRERPDAALLNPRLNDGSAMPFVEALCLAKVPFALVSDRKDNNREAMLRDAPRLDWPYGVKELRRTLLQLLQGQDQSLRGTNA